MKISVPNFRNSPNYFKKPALGTYLLKCKGVKKFPSIFSVAIFPWGSNHVGVILQNGLDHASEGAVDLSSPLKVEAMQHLPFKSKYSVRRLVKPPWDQQKVVLISSWFY